jgi:hypothetical protein
LRFDVGAISAPLLLALAAHRLLAGFLRLEPRRAAVLIDEIEDITTVTSGIGGRSRNFDLIASVRGS